MERNNDIPKEPEAVRKERIALIKSLSTKKVPSKKIYNRKDAGNASED